MPSYVGAPTCYVECPTLLLNQHSYSVKRLTLLNAQLPFINIRVIGYIYCSNYIVTLEHIGVVPKSFQYPFPYQNEYSAFKGIYAILSLEVAY